MGLANKETIALQKIDIEYVDTAIEKMALINDPAHDLTKKQLLSLRNEGKPLDRPIIHKSIQLLNQYEIDNLCNPGPEFKKHHEAYKALHVIYEEKQKDLFKESGFALQL